MQYDLKGTTKLLSEIMFTTEKNEFEIYFKARLVLKMNVRQERN